MLTGTSSGAPGPPGHARHGLYILVASFLALLVSVAAIVRPSLNPVLWFAGRLFRDAAASYRFKSGLGYGVTAPYLIAESIINVLAWALLIYAAEYGLYRWHARSSAGIKARAA